MVPDDDSVVRALEERNARLTDELTETRAVLRDLRISTSRLLDYMMQTKRQSARGELAAMPRGGGKQVR